uniref:G_PROTEIN_RECEP_F1_2 domain-containing protein n=1 Tax=Strongyloides papillosus TaxID=174720 RepID=A0A0N5BZG3_STREA
MASSLLSELLPKYKITVEDILNRNINQTKMRNFLRVFHIHRLTDNSLENDLCEDSYIYKLLMGKIFLGVFGIALIGNITNILVYKRDHIRNYITIKLLCSKLILNTITLILLLPHTLRIIGLWESGSTIDYYYYYIFWPLELFFVNLFGFCATWITVFMTAECVMTSYAPGYSKLIWTRRNVILSYVVLGVLGTLMAIIYPLNRRAILNNDGGKIKVIISTSDNIFLGKIEKIHTIINLLISIIIPLILLIILTVVLFYRFVIYRKTETGILLKFTKEKRCVVKISVLTTVLFILSEIPAIPVFINSFTRGTHAIYQDKILCRWLTLSHFCGICNSSLSFLIYFMFSRRFRESLINFIKITYNRFVHVWINRLHLIICKKGHNTNVINKNNRILWNNLRTTKQSHSKPALPVNQQVLYISSSNDQCGNSGFVQLLPTISIKTSSENSNYVDI